MANDRPSLELTSLPLPELTSGPWAGSRYLPIEAFRGPEAAALFRGDAVVRTFLSSGTTSHDRAQSHFSATGLSAYKTHCLAHFRQILSAVLPNRGANAVGISLIPEVHEWPDSSLAQMLGWISEVFPLVFVAPAALPAAISRFKDQPLWLFGTAFHWLNVLDQGQSRRLPAGSVVFETGGTKGRARAVTRLELYNELASGFGLSTAAVISEYGMSELACQAYDFVPFGTQIAESDRRFRLPSAVRIAALTAAGCAVESGRGALLVADPARADYPWPIRTEDLIEIGVDGFRLLGRAPVAPLKGCSLLAEELRTPNGNAQLNRPVLAAAFGPAKPLLASETAKRIDALPAMLESFLASQATVALLAAELGSTNAAAAALADVQSGLPTNNHNWLAAVDHARGTESLPNDWLVILPDNHSLVGLYPVAIAYLLGLRLVVRVPRRFTEGPNLLTAFLATLGNLPGNDLHLTGPEWRLGSDQEGPLVSAILAYGGNETLEVIKQHTAARVQGFGHRIGVAAVAFADLERLAPLVIRDALSLGQTGCMATRLILVYGSDSRISGQAEVAAAARALQSEGANFWGLALPWQQRVCLDMEAYRLAKTRASLWMPRTSAEPLVSWLDAANGLSADTIELAIARCPFTISILAIPDHDPTAAVLKISHHLRERHCLGTFTTSHLTWPSLTIRRLGTANVPLWNGFHEEERLYGGLPANLVRS